MLNTVGRTSNRCTWGYRGAHVDLVLTHASSVCSTLCRSGLRTHSPIEYYNTTSGFTLRSARCFLNSCALERSTKLLLLLVIVSALPGCALSKHFKSDLYQDYSVLPLEDAHTTSAYKLMQSLQASVSGGTSEPQRPPLLEQKCFAVSIPLEDQPVCIQERNTAISVLILASEDMCVQHRKTIYGNDATTNITFGTFTNLFAGAASVVSPAAAKSVLAALAFFSNSERSLVNETIYKTMLVTAVDKKIGEIRETKAQAIYTGLQQDIQHYTSVQALSDVIKLHYSCSFMTGLQKALDEGTQSSAAQKILRLRESLRAVSADIDSIPPGDRTGARKPQFDQLMSRYQAINEELKKLETQ